MMINVYLIQIVFWMVCHCFKGKCKCADECAAKYQKVLFWGTLIRLLFEGYLELCLSIFVGLTDLEWLEDNYSVTYNNIFTIVFSILLIGLPVFILGFYSNFLDKLDDETF